MSSYCENGLLDETLYSEDILKHLDLNKLNMKFSPPISLNMPGQNLRIRPLKSGDFDRGYLQLLSQLTKVGDYSRKEFMERFEAMKMCPETYYVTILEDISKNQVIGTASFVVEMKFIRNAGKRGRMEDVVINDEYRGKQLGKLLIAVVQLLSRHLGCYKVTLDCKDGMVPYYQNMGFNQEAGNSTTMVIRHSES